jgi:hypothetical protein
MQQKPGPFAKTVLSLGLLSFVLLIAGFLLINLYPPTTHNRYAEEVGVILLDDYGPDVLALGWLLGFLTVVLRVVFWLVNRKSGKAGKGLATIGVLFGCISLFASFVYIQSHVGFSIRQPRPAEEDAISDVRQIITSQISYSMTIGQGSYAPSLKELQDEGLINDTLGSGTTNWYRFLITAGPTDEQGKITTFSIVASPVEYGVTGWANFYSDESGVIRYTVEDRPAQFKDPPLGTLPMRQFR